MQVEVVVVAIGWRWLNDHSHNVRKKETTKKRIPLARKAL